MKTSRRDFLKTSAAAGLAGVTKPQAAALFKSALPANAERVFVGPEFWANRLQDWRISKGRIECVDKRSENPMDYRAAALIHHQPGPGGGLFAGCDANGNVFFRDFTKP
jgi:TAT (twin-arginine translocation) pathway signal sequence